MLTRLIEIANGEILRFYSKLIPVADSSISAPPSFLPAKKYSDISGLTVSCSLKTTHKCYKKRLATCRSFLRQMFTLYPVASFLVTVSKLL
jgi:hypothetical protein